MVKKTVEIQKYKQILSRKVVFRKNAEEGFKVERALNLKNQENQGKIVTIKRMIEKIVKFKKIVKKKQIKVIKFE